MKARIVLPVFALVLLGFFCSTLCWSRQVVTDEDKSWAKNTIAQEETLQGTTTPNSLAILYFTNKTQWKRLDLLQKGLTLMLITDLSAIPDFQLVERVKIQALLDEMDLSDKAIFSPSHRARIGKLLGARHIVGGKILERATDQFRFDSRLLEIQAENIIANPQSQGTLLKELFQMEKKLLFEIIEELNIVLTDEQRTQLEKPVTFDIMALLHLFEGLILCDLEDYSKAVEKIQLALQRDPDFLLAKEFLADIYLNFLKPAAGNAPAPDQFDPRLFRGANHLGDPFDRSAIIDDDQDGFPAGPEDCDDTNPAINIGAIEICDAVDNNCDGLVDEGFDNDGDGFASCFECDDINPAINPGALEICNAVDDNCDGIVDEGFDLDGDGFASCFECDDINPTINPSAIDICNGVDDNCDGRVDEGFDLDGDGFASCFECDDGNPTVNPATAEICNGIDDDCDGLADEGFDNDGDGYASCFDSDNNNPNVNPGAPELCNGIDDNSNGQVDEGFDSDGDGFASCFECNDNNPAIHPGATETCNGIDDNCNGNIDEGFDDDGDTYASCFECDDTNANINPGVLETCNGVDDNCNGIIDEGMDADGDGFTSCTECDDSNAAIFPGAIEACNGVDDDCNGVIDEGFDGDGDGYASCFDCNDGNDTVHPGAQEACNGIDDSCNGQTDEGLDGDGDGFAFCFECDDSNASIFPGAVELCNGLDDNCDGVMDDWLDSDGDTYSQCQECDDTNPNINPGALETCNGVDDNCSGQIDEGFDGDGDGFATCFECDDNNINIFPGAAELCNNLDDNCNGQVDEGFDGDGDGFASCNDCNDGDASIFPGAPEACNNIDDNCDGVIDDFLDGDNDGFANCQECDDTNPAVYPGATEACNTIDDNCDGQIDEGFDSDGDGFIVCVDDCDDGDASINPLAMELCDTIDNNCDGTVDEGACTDYPDGTPPLIVDLQSIIMAQQNYLTDPNLAVQVDSGYYKPGLFSSSAGAGYLNWGYEWTPTTGVPNPYQPGLQMIGMVNGNVELLTDTASLNAINNDAFLAYTVQVEEDRLNRTILDMHRLEAQGNLLLTINDALTSGDIRTRDDLLLQQADAQSGRVLMDHDGNWIRVQQYILRPDNTTIQVLNVNLRGGGEHAGLSCMDFTTTLNSSFPITSDLRALPWSDWLHTRGPQMPTGQGEADWRYISSNNDSLAGMSIRLTSPSGDYLLESRLFGASTTWINGSGQPITSETLELSFNGHVGNFTYTTDWQNAPRDEYWLFSDTNFQLSQQSTHPAPFYYMQRTGPFHDNPALDQVSPLVTAQFFVVGDGHISPDPSSGIQGNQGVSQNDYSNIGFTDIWDALRVNESDESASWIGQNNLEMLFTKASLSGPTPSINLVYIPMSRMVWNPSRSLPTP